jgi:hypothetical protein
MYSLFKNAPGLSRAVVCAPLALLPGVLLALSSCSSAPKVEKTSTAAYREGVPGGTLVEAYKITARVTGINEASRKVTLKAADGSSNTFAAGPGDRDFDQLRVGDQVRALVTRQLVVLLGVNNEPAEEGPVLPPILTAADDQAGVMRSDTMERTARIGAVDRKRRQATLVFPDGVSKVFAIRDDVDPRRVKVGANVAIRTSSSVVLTLRK